MKGLVASFILVVAITLVPGHAATSPSSPTPLPRAHAHNDYEHPRPLLDALSHGFCSVEADVHLVDVSDVAAEVVDSVVTVNITVDIRGPGDLTGSGSGVILDSEGTVVTNAHVVSNATVVTVTLADGTTCDASVVGVPPPAGTDMTLPE